MCQDVKAQKKPEHTSTDYSKQKWKAEGIQTGVLTRKAENEILLLKIQWARWLEKKSKNLEVQLKEFWVSVNSFKCQAFSMKTAENRQTFKQFVGHNRRLSSLLLQLLNAITPRLLEKEKKIVIQYWGTSTSKN